MYLLQWNSAAWYSVSVILVILNLDTYCRAGEIQLSEVGKKPFWPGESRTENATVLAHLASHNLVRISQLQWQCLSIFQTFLNIKFKKTVLSVKCNAMLLCFLFNLTKSAKIRISHLCTCIHISSQQVPLKMKWTKWFSQIKFLEKKLHGGNNNFFHWFQVVGFHVY